MLVLPACVACCRIYCCKPGPQFTTGNAIHVTKNVETPQLCEVKLKLVPVHTTLKEPRRDFLLHVFVDYSKKIVLKKKNPQKLYYFQYIL